MSDDERERDRDEACERLQRAVEAVAGGPPSIVDLYALDPLFEYRDMVLPARDALLASWSRAGNAAAWAVELRRPPPDWSLWFASYDRRRVTSEALTNRAAEWAARGPDRMFDAHRHLSPTSDVARLHLLALFELDPRGAIEWVASLPLQDMVWAGAHQIDLSTKSALIDEVLAESSADAVLLVLADTIERQARRASMRGNARRWASGAGSPPDENESPAELRLRHRTIAGLLVSRADAGAMLGPWMRTLVRYVDRASGVVADPASGRIAQIAMNEVELALEIAEPVNLAPAPSLDTACVTARIVADRGNLHAEVHWAEWGQLVIAEHDSLFATHAAQWRIAGWALCNVGDPLVAWLDAARSLEPVSRRRTRGYSERPQPVPHLVMPGIFAAMHIGSVAAPLWRSAYELARRLFLLDGGATADTIEHSLCADVFVAFRRVFGADDRLLDELLAQLPTDKHVISARRHVAPAPALAPPPSGEQRLLPVRINDCIDAMWFGSGFQGHKPFIDTHDGSLVDLPAERRMAHHAPLPDPPNVDWRFRRFDNLNADADPDLTVTQELLPTLLAPGERRRQWDEFDREADKLYIIEWLATLGIKPAG